MKYKKKKNKTPFVFGVILVEVRTEKQGCMGNRKFQILWISYNREVQHTLQYMIV